MYRVSVKQDSEDVSLVSLENVQKLSLDSKFEGFRYSCRLPKDQNNEINYLGNVTTQKLKFPIKDFFSKCGQIRSFPRIWSHLLKKILNGKLHFLCSVCTSIVRPPLIYIQFTNLDIDI